jgi:hypothetical protein
MAKKKVSRSGIKLVQRGKKKFRVVTATSAEIKGIIEGRGNGDAELLSLAKAERRRRQIGRMWQY